MTSVLSPSLPLLPSLPEHGCSSVNPPLHSLHLPPFLCPLPTAQQGSVRVDWKINLLHQPSSSYPFSCRIVIAACQHRLVEDEGVSRGCCCCSPHGCLPALTARQLFAAARTKTPTHQGGALLCCIISAPFNRSDPSPCSCPCPSCPCPCLTLPFTTELSTSLLLQREVPGKFVSAHDSNRCEQQSPRDWVASAQFGGANEEV
jgi:hypothetical protein